MKKLAMIVGLLMCLSVAGNASAITVDGNFGDAEWAGYFTNDDGHIGPGGGGQFYDVEKLGMKIQGGTVYFGLQTGFDFINGYGGYHAGDLAIDIGADGTYEYAIEIASAPNFALHNIADPLTGWIPAPAPFTESSPLERVADNLNPATITGAYANFNDAQGAHYVLEGSFNLSALSLYTTGTDINFHWTMSCGNDYVTHNVPEPATLLMIGSGLVGLGFIRRKFKV